MQQQNLSLQMLIAKQIRMSELTAMNFEHANQILERANKLIPLSDHPNLIKIQECFIQQKQLVNPDHPNKKHVFIRTQNFIGEKLQAIVNNLQINQIENIYRQLKSVVEYLHKNNFYMIDLSLSNVLIDKSNRVKFQLSCFYKYILGKFDPDLYYQAESFLYRCKINHQRSYQIILKLSLLELMTKRIITCAKCKSSSSFHICKYQLCTQNKLFCLACDQLSHFFHKTKKIKQRSFVETIFLLQFLQHGQERISINVKNKKFDWIHDIFQSIHNIEILHKNNSLTQSIGHVQALHINSYNNIICCCQQLRFTFNRYYENRNNQENIIQAIYYEQLNLVSLEDEFIGFILESQQKQKIPPSSTFDYSDY